MEDQKEEPLDLTETWHRFKNRSFEISAKQRFFIEKLMQSLGIEGEQPRLDYLTEMMRRPITSWKDLNPDEVSKAIYILKQRQKPSRPTLAEVKKLYSIDEINQIFSKQKYPNLITDYEELTQGRTNLLLNQKKRFKTIYKDHPIEATMDYEYGWQDSPLCQDSRMSYLKFYDLLMLDYDELSYDEVIAILQPMRDSHYFEIHQTHNGYHVFLLSELLNHRNAAATALMTRLKCDHFYILFCYDNGFKIRLSKKLDRDETFIARVVGRYGNEALLNPECQKLLDLFHSFLKAESKKE